MPKPEVPKGPCGGLSKYGPFLGPYYNTGPNLGDPKRDHNFDNPPCSYMVYTWAQSSYMGSPLGSMYA